jgi:hypothetical protein
MYCTGNAVHIAWANSAFGPWNNAVANNGTLYNSGDLTRGSDWIDPQFFVDTNTVYFTFGQSSNMGIAKLKFDATTFLVTIDGSDTRMTDGVKYKCKRFTGLSNNLEGSSMFRNGSRYFITYSNSACHNYNVRYSVASSPVEPFTYINRTIVQRDNEKCILGPGHNSILNYKNDWYICYHRQHYQYVDVKRQTCIDHITISGDNITASSQTLEGVWEGSGSLETLVAQGRSIREKDLAFGKTVLASSESAYKGGRSGNQSEQFSQINGFYKGRYAIDRNNGTRWAPSSLPGYLIIDLGKNFHLGRCETTFELIMRAYSYRIEYLDEADAVDINAANSAGKWKMYADRSNNTDNISPVVDSNAVNARYLKLTLLSGNIPKDNAQIRTITETDYADRLSVFEFKVFEDQSTSCWNTIPAPQLPLLRVTANGVLTYSIRQNGNVTITLLDSRGRCLYRDKSRKTSNTYCLNVADFNVSSGVYFLSIQTPDLQDIQMINLFH